MKPSSTNGFVRLYNASIYSWQGFVAAFRHEQAFRLELYLLVVFVPLAFYLTDNSLERALMIGSWLLVMTIELINSAIEAVVDRFGGEQHELSGRAKDIGSAAVFIGLVIVAVIWAGILLP